MTSQVDPGKINRPSIAWVILLANDRHSRPRFLSDFSSPDGVFAHHRVQLWFVKASKFRARLDMCGSLPCIIKERFEQMQTATRTKRTERLDARVTKDEKRVIETAADLRGLTVTDLMRTVLTDAAARIIRESEVLVLSARSRAAFVDALMNPPMPSARMLAAAQRYRQEVR